MNFSLIEFVMIRKFLFILFISFAYCQDFGNDCFTPSRHPLDPEKCEPTSRYRSFSGRCNNLQNPEWGASGSIQARILPAAYEDGISVPRGGLKESRLPNPRWISQKNHPDFDETDPRFTHMLMQFGQFLDHDLAMAPKDDTLNCCTNPGDGHNCFVIPIPEDDRLFSWVNSSSKCLNLVRSQPLCKASVRQQHNKPSSYIDVSTLYGSEPDIAALLRTFTEGKLHRNPHNDQLPTLLQLNVAPNTKILRPQNESDFLAGDDRVNEHPFLSSIHLIFLREHNRIVKLLKEYLPDHLQKDEILYQETRRIVLGEFQHIVYNEFLPSVIGPEYMKRYDLISKEEEGSSYDPSIDASIINSFANAAFRFGHSMINGMFKLVSQRSTKVEKDKVYWLWRLREVFDGQSILGATLPLENMIEGLITQQAQTCDAFFTTEITDHLFQRNIFSHNFGQDLLAINIQRARDHGLPDYGQYRVLCGLKPLSSWSSKPEEHSTAYWDKLQSVYKNVNDIDLFVGAIAERPVKDGAIGPTFACIIGIQFSLLKKGDRFFYNHSPNSELHVQGLDPIARKEIFKRRLSDILCETTRLEKIQKLAILQVNEKTNPLLPCGGRNSLDMKSIAGELLRVLSNFSSGSQKPLSGTAPLFPNSI